LVGAVEKSCTGIKVISNNNGGSVYPYTSCNNKIYLNNFIKNTDNVFSYSRSINILNATEEKNVNAKKED